MVVGVIGWCGTAESANSRRAALAMGLQTELPARGGRAQTDTRAQIDAAGTSDAAHGNLSDRAPAAGSKGGGNRRRQETSAQPLLLQSALLRHRQSSRYLGY